MKQCSKCKETKEVAAFSKCAKAPDGLQYQCKACHAERFAANKADIAAKHKAWCEANKEHSRKYRREWTKRNPIAVTAKALKRDYGISVAQYEKMFDDQEGCCAICSRFLTSQITEVRAESKRDVAHVDHCHSTNAVRGLLCFNCNVGLGKFKDDETLLLAAARYLAQANRGNASRPHNDTVQGRKEPSDRDLQSTLTVESRP